MTDTTLQETRSSGRSKNQDRETVISVRDANVTFGMDRGESRVLKDANLDIYEDEILGVVGESGSGKSMFASALLDAIVDPGELTGDITYYGGDKPVDLLSLDRTELMSLRWEEISFVFQGAMSSFNPTMEVGEHFAETLKAHDYDVSEGMEHGRELLSDLYLQPERVLNSYPHELSGGMKQRALIALSLILQPEVLVMDEPTAALDLLMQRSIFSLLENLKEKYDLTIVFITHDLPLVAGLADRLAVMYAFEFAEIGPARNVIENPAHPYTRALLNAVPNLETPLSEMRPIEGAAPDPVDVPHGCSYHPRCPLSDESCVAEDPPFKRVDTDHEAACFYWEESREQIELAEESSSESSEEWIETKPQSDEPVVSIDDVDVHFEEENDGLFGLFGESNTVHAVDNANVDIHENDVVALVGESGCGKTTLGKTAIGVQRPTNGSVEYRDQDIWDARDGSRDAEIPYKDIRHALQIIPQDPGSSLNPNRSVQASLEEPLRRINQNLNSQDQQERILNMLEYVGMSPPEDYASRYPHQLSGGEKQRVALIRALLMNPDLILADEAISALDVSLRVDMMDLMLELQDHFDTSYLFISHNLSNARYLAGKSGGRIGVMYLGEIVEIGPAEEIINNPQHPYTKVLMWATADLDANGGMEEPPIRNIDIPDPVDPPSGCRFHTRCPEAREHCRVENPQGAAVEGDHEIACFRACDEDHPYWDSEPLMDNPPSRTTDGEVTDR